jgi:hypothetical protein
MSRIIADVLIRCTRCMVCALLPLLVASRLAIAQDLLVDRRPLLSLTDGEAEVSIGSEPEVRFLGSGRFAIVDTDANAIHFFDARARHLRSVGRAGDGPFEFRAPSAFGRHHDSLLVYDAMHRRVSVLTAEGRRVRELTVALRRATQSVRPIGVFSDGQWLARGIGLPPRARQSLTYRDTLRVYRISPDASEWSQVATLLGDEMMIAAEPPNIIAAPAILGARTWLLVAGSALAVVHSAVIGYDTVDVTGRARRVAEEPLPPIGVTDALWRNAVRERLTLFPTGIPQVRESYRRMYAAAARPSLAPLAADAIGEPRGAVWVRAAHAPIWYRFSPGSTRPRILRLREGETLLAVEDDRIAVETQDADDVKTVRIFRVVE